MNNKIEGQDALMSASFHAGVFARKRIGRGAGNLGAMVGGVGNAGKILGLLGLLLRPVELSFELQDRGSADAGDRAVLLGHDRGLGEPS